MAISKVYEYIDIMNKDAELLAVLRQGNGNNDLDLQAILGRLRPLCPPSTGSQEAHRDV